MAGWGVVAGGAGTINVAGRFRGRVQSLQVQTL